MQFSLVQKAVAGILERLLSLKFALSFLACVGLSLFLAASSPAQQVSLAWNPNTEPTLAGYRIYYGTSSRIYTFQRDVGNVTQCTISGLEPGRTYYFAATAYDNQGHESAYSAEIKTTLPLENRAPSAMGSSFQVIQNGVLKGTLKGTDPDGDPLTFRIVTRPTKGSLVLNNSTTGAFTYQPNTGVVNTSDSFTFSVYDGKLSSSTAMVSIAVTAQEPRVTQGLQALYTFDEGMGGTVFDVSGVGVPLDLRVNNTSRIKWVEGGLSVTGATLIASDEPAGKIVDAVSRSNEITIEAWIKPASATQTGPARIVTLSTDTSLRNFTLGQGVNDGSSHLYGVRLRTTTSSLNGLPSLDTPHGTPSTKLTHIVYTRNASGTARLYVDGQQQAAGTVGGTLSNWNTSYRFALANEFTGDRPWLGEFQLVAIYSRALSAAEISQNLSAGSKPYEVKRAPAITRQPENQSVTAGSAAEFTLEAEGSSPLFYQWQRRVGTTWYDISQATAPSCTIPSTKLEDDNTSYRCRVWNSEGSLTSAAALLSVRSASGWQRVTTGLQALYRFKEGGGSIIRDTSGVGTALDLVVNNPAWVRWLPGGGLAITNATIIASPGAASKISQGVRSTGEITIEAWIKPANTWQNGPARVVTLSSDAFHRNFTLGQGIFGGSPAVYDVRFRSSDTDLNGMPSITSPPGSLSTVLTHVVYTRNTSGLAKLYLNGQEKASGLVGGTPSNWETGFRLALGNELTEDRPWLGEFHLVALYSRALNQEEILRNYWSGTN